MISRGVEVVLSPDTGHEIRGEGLQLDPSNGRRKDCMLPMAVAGNTGCGLLPPFCAILNFLLLSNRQQM